MIDLHIGHFESSKIIFLLQAKQVSLWPQPYTILFLFEKQTEHAWSELGDTFISSPSGVKFLGIFEACSLASSACLYLFLSV